MAGVGSRRLEEEDAEAAWHAADLRGRTALLAATGENAHEQLAAARTALTALAASEDHGTVLPPEDRERLLAEATRAVDRVSRLVDDLRDLSRLHAGAVETYLRPVDLEEVLAASLDDLGPGRQERHPQPGRGPARRDRRRDAPDPDPGQPAGRCHPPLPGGPAARAHRRPARRPGRGLRRGQGPDERGGPASLSLRLAADLAEAMGVTLRCERTPCGGRTVIIILPAAARPPAGAPTRAKDPDDEEMQLT